jgi:Dolichyl-phosphate-mannose-protein mannosyltransferase
MNSAYFGKRLLLFVIPVYSIIVCCIFLKKFSPFYLNQPDPCYSYLFNGMNVLGGSMEKQAFKNLLQPGATIQCFASGVIFIENFLFSSHTPIYQDVIQNPESYLYTCSIVLILLLVCINYLTGRYVFRHTGSIGASMLLQITPLINIDIVKRAIVLEPESLIIIMSTFFMAYLFLKAPENNIKTDNQQNKKTVILFGIFSGFLIASKYTCVPVIFLVLFILEKNKDRLVYMGTVILSFFIFIIPVLPKIRNVFQWVRNFSVYNDIYGNVDEQAMNPSQFIKNFKDLFLADTVFTSIYFIITMAFLVTLVDRIRKRETPFIRTISGIWFSITALILAVAKHCDFHYLIFAECCFPLGLAVSYKIFSGSFSPFMQNFANYKKKILYSGFILFLLFLVVEKIRYIPLHYLQPVSIDKYTDEYKTVPLIISIKSGLACGRKEPALYLGYMYAGGTQELYAKVLKQMYPNTYIYWNGSQTLSYWDETISIPEFSTKNKKMLLYLKGYDDAEELSVLNKLWVDNLRVKTVEKEIVFKDPKTLQSIYMIDSSHE